MSLYNNTGGYQQWLGLPISSQQGQREVVELWIYFGGRARSFADQLDGKQEEEKSRIVPWLWPEPQKGSVALN